MQSFLSSVVDEHFEHIRQKFRQLYSGNRRGSCRSPDVTSGYSSKIGGKVRCSILRKYQKDDPLSAYKSVAVVVAIAAVVVVVLAKIAAVVDIF
ncbi:hypothetical protein CEXT_521591 [Caerostris extrusa]|uniref:Uncharacterized protein n=1 Tax=Caerostris extrusa TaxID=172846 RepID=A0AAV4XX37_CAEEX|nr:hypothetical protein CEXT_521591 [Caerostris extrusa]